jgi:alkaline phosphatase
MRQQTSAPLSMTAIASALLAVTMSAHAVPPVAPDDLPRRGPKGNVIFIHPDGTGPNHWAAARMYWYGPDAVSGWDRLPFMASYRGHMTDVLTGTSNGGATTHAFGYKVSGPGSFGKDGDGALARDILALSGYPGSILREAANAGHPTGVVNDGDLPEPGTGVFFAEVSNRNLSNEIARQLIDGRPGFETEDKPPVVAMGGGEGFFLPQGMPPCTTEVTPACAVHVDQVSGSGPSRDDGRNLVQEALAKGWVVLRTREEFDAFRADLEADKSWKPRVLGLFARDDIFNDLPEERLLSLGLIDETRSPDDKRGRIITHGSKPGTLGYNPPTAAEMTDVALEILDRWKRASGKPFYLVTEVEATDNMGNNDNAIGTLVGMEHANRIYEAAVSYLERDPRTLILTTADSDAGGMQVRATTSNNAGSDNVNPTGTSSQNVFGPLDGIEGRGSATFVAEPDQFGQSLRFAISWVGTPDVAGGIVTRAAGLNAELLNRSLSARHDNIDIYRLAYLTLFGKGLPYPQGKFAPDR